MILDDVNIPCEITHDQIVARIQHFYEELSRQIEISIDDEKHELKEMLNELLVTYEETFDSIIYIN